MKALRPALLSLVLSLLLTACGSGLPTVTNGDTGEKKAPEAGAPSVEAQEPAIPTENKGPAAGDSSPEAEAPVIPQGNEESEENNSRPAVTPEAPTGGNSITASHEDATLLAPGENFRFLPVGVKGVYAATYISKNSSVATVDGDTGKVTAVGVGKTTVSMHFEGDGEVHDFDCIVRCSWDEEEFSKVTASHEDVTLLNPGESFRFLPVGAGGVYAAEYTIGDESVATVDPSNGKVTAVGTGKTTVSMHFEGNGEIHDFDCIVRCSW
ncbi:MAG: hypothetical protein HFF79_03395 [Oscillospiraceae bacterium]|nr:hypothetical protein [Oscillospiraceae bacterium]